MEIQENWRTKVYLTWGGIGLTFGLLAGYFYTRAAKEYAARSGNPPRVSTGDLLGLLLAAVAALRQIAELGKPKHADKKK